jgi:hypothetical protein
LRGCHQGEGATQRLAKRSETDGRQSDNIRDTVAFSLAR